MKTVYKNKDLYLVHISHDGSYVLVTRDPEMKTKIFKVDSEEIEDKTILKKLKKQQNTL